MYPVFVESAGEALHCRLVVAVGFPTHAGDSLGPCVTMRVLTGGTLLGRGCFLFVRSSRVNTRGTLGLIPSSRATWTWLRPLSGVTLPTSNLSSRLQCRRSRLTLITPSPVEENVSLSGCASNQGTTRRILERTMQASTFHDPKVSRRFTSVNAHQKLIISASSSVL